MECARRCGLECGGARPLAARRRRRASRRSRARCSFAETQISQSRFGAAAPVDASPVCGGAAPADTEPLKCSSCDCRVHEACAQRGAADEGDWQCAVCDAAEEQAPRARRRTQLIPFAQPETRAAQLAARCSACGEAGGGEAEGGRGEIFFCDARGCFGAFHRGCVDARAPPAPPNKQFAAPPNAALGDAIAERCQLCRARHEAQIRPARDARLQLEHFQVRFAAGLDKVEQARMTLIVLGQAPSISPQLQALFVTAYCVTDDTEAATDGADWSNNGETAPRREAETFWDADAPAGSAAFQQKHYADAHQGPPPATPQCFPISNGWWRKFDPTSARWYFVHESTGSCQWDWPTEAGGLQP
mmetsp:Transcript_11937/g.42209  ORF Transcript_11937/g.42209 Transcript_11937/m.42209 type:complete len:360 (+) Transcript_11937:129-1208(+)